MNLTKAQGVETRNPEDHAYQIHEFDKVRLVKPRHPEKRVY